MRGPGRRPGAAPDWLPGNRVYFGTVGSFGLGELGTQKVGERAAHLGVGGHSSFALASGSCQSPVTGVPA